MSFFKALITAILVTLLVTYFLGSSILQFFDVNIAHSSWQESIEAINVSAVFALFVLFLGSFIILTVFGTVILLVTLFFLVIFGFVLGTFWPIILVAFVLYYLCRDKKSDDYHCG